METNPVNENSVAIIGMSCRFPMADSIEAFWENLKNGRECISFFSDEELRDSGVNPTVFNRPEYVRARGVLENDAGFDAGFFGFNPREAEITDVQHRIFLECAWEALERAGYDPHRYEGAIGVFAGMDMSRYLLNCIYPSLENRGMASAYQALIGNDKDFLATLTAYKLNLKGPAVGVQTACSTSLTAAHLACQSLLTGECDMALAGGVCVDVPQKTGYMYEEGMILSPDGHCRPFDARAKGTLSGNGCGVVLLKRLPEAVKDQDKIRAVIRGSAVNNDGAARVGYTAPGVEGQARVIAEAMAVADVDPETITCIEAHGTGTPLGDPIEIHALTQAFGDVSRKQFCAVGSVKSSIGHTGSAAGAAGLIKTVLALEHGLIPPSLNFETPNPKIHFSDTPFYVNTDLRPWQTAGFPRRAGVSSFGIGGTNVHMILEESPRPVPSAPEPSPSQLILISARTPSALESASANLAGHFKTHPDLNLADAAYTLQMGRQGFEHRRMLVCADAAQAASVLGSPDMPGVLTGARKQGEPEMVFMFPGQGAQYPGMGKGLYDSEPVFRREMDRCAEILKPALGLDLRRVLYSDADGAVDLNHTSIAQPAIFAVSYALASLWISWGILPRAMIGHSIGEYAAAALAGVFSLEEALKLTALRGRLMGRMPSGAMTAVPLSPDEISPFLNQSLSLAAVNTPLLCVVSGEEPAITGLEDRLKARGIAPRRLHTSHAFHSAMIDPVLEPFAQHIRNISLRPPRIPYLSNLTGTWIRDEEAADPEYWVQHMRRTVRFSDGMGVLLENPNRIFLETGPGRTLSVFALRHPDKKPDQAVLTSIRHPREDRADRDFLLAALGRLWVLGAEPDWQAVHSKPVRRILLPAYPFERKPYWIKPHSSQTDTPRFKTGKNPDLDEWFYLPSWKRSLPCSGETLSRTGLPELTAPKTWLIFADKTGQGRHLAEKLKKAGQTVAMAHKGPDFTRTGAADYTINPEEPSGYDALFRELQDQGLKPAFILHLWNLDPAGHNPLDVKQMLDQGIYSLLYLVQTLGRRNFADPLTIMVIGSGTQEVTGEEELCPIKAALLGPVKVIPLEYPNIQCRYIDVILPGLEAAEQLSGQIIAETLSEHSGPVTAFRGNYRWIPDIEPVRLPPQTRPRLREGGTYLITGGLGGMGLSIAGYIAENFRANLILTGRSEFPDESKWEVWVSEHGEHHPVSVKILKLKTIRAAGSPVLICRADAADPDQMKKAVDQAHERFGGIHGLIHTAGLADQAGVIQRRTREMTEQVLAPKIMGTLVLEQVLKNETLDFIFLCSSLGNILYHTKFGQAAYNAANEFLDLYACYQARTRGPFTVSVNWDDWSEAGMSAAALSASADGRGFKNLGGLLKEVLSEGLSSSEGTDVFRRIADSPFHRIAVSTQDLRIQIEQEALKTHMILETVFQKRASGPAHARPDLSTAYAAPKDEIETTLSDIWGELLGIQGIGVHDNFFDLGGDSLIATQVLSRIREAFDTPITLNEFFENPTIKGLARTIFEENIKTQDQDEMARLLAEIEGMSEDEAARRLSESM